MDPSVYPYLLIVVSSIVGFKLGRGTRKARFDQNVDARRTAQQSLSDAQTSVTDVSTRMDWILIDYPSAAGDYKKNAIERAIKRVEVLYKPLADLLERSKQLQLHKKRTSPHLYASNSDDLYKAARKLNEMVAHLNGCLDDLEEHNARLSTQSLQNRLNDLQKRYVDFLTDFVETTNRTPTPLRRDRRFKELAASIEDLVKDQASVVDSLNTDAVDRYVIDQQIDELHNSCRALREAHCQLDRDASLFYALGSMNMRRRLRAKNGAEPSHTH